MKLNGAIFLNGLSERTPVDEETVIRANKNYAAISDKDLNLLAVYASKFGVDKI